MDQPVSKNNNFMHIPPLSPPSNPSFLTQSLPNSACSSPRFSSTRLKNKSRNSVNQQDSIAVANLERLREIHLMRKSKSCGDGRSTAVAADLGLRIQLSKPKKQKQENNSNKNIRFERSVVKKTRSITKETLNVDQEDKNTIGETMEKCEKRFKCGALCLFLPGFSKAKPVKTKVVQPDIKVSKRVSLQKFECGSWRSSVIMMNNNNDNEEDADNSNHFFDLPLECW